MASRSSPPSPSQSPSTTNSTLVPAPGPGPAHVPAPVSGVNHESGSPNGSRRRPLPSEGPMLSRRQHGDVMEEGIGMAFLRRLAVLVQFGFRGCTSVASIHCACVVAMQIGSAVLFFESNIATGPIVDAIIGGSADTIASTFAKALLLSLAAVVLQVVSAYWGELLRLQWRRRVVLCIHDLYFRHKATYYVNNIHRAVDNTDQRLTQDVEDFTSTAGLLMFGGYKNFTSMWYTLTSASISLWYVATKLSWIPMVLSVTWCALAAGLTTSLIAPVARRAFRVNAAVGSFRFIHSRIREFAESIALYSGYEVEIARAVQAFRHVFSHSLWLYFYEFLLSAWTGFQYGFPTILSYVAVALVMRYGHHGPLAKPDVTAGTLSVSAYAVSSFIGALAAVPFILGSFGTLSGYTHRVGQLVEALQQHSVVDKEGTHDSGSAFSPPAAKDVCRQLSGSASTPTACFVASSSSQSASSRAFAVECEDLLTSSQDCAQEATRHQALEPPISSSDLSAPGLDVLADGLHVRGLRVVSPRGTTLVERLSFSVFPGSSVLVVGPSGCGKTSLLRIVAGLWPATEGSVSFQPPSLRRELLVVPQRPYMTMGTLRDQVLYPRFLVTETGTLSMSAAALDPRPVSSPAPQDSQSIHAETQVGQPASCHSVDTSDGVDDGDLTHPLLSRADPAQGGLPASGIELGRPVDSHVEYASDGPAGLSAPSDTYLRHILESLGLGHLVDEPESLDVACKWDEILSIGEQQRIGFARLLCHRPRFAILDEATSALDEASERVCMELCRTMGITVLSVGHSPSLAQYHSRAVVIASDGSWRLIPANQVRSLDHGLDVQLAGVSGVSGAGAGAGAGGFPVANTHSGALSHGRPGDSASASTIQPPSRLQVDRAKSSESVPSSASSSSASATTTQRQRSYGCNRTFARLLCKLLKVGFPRLFHWNVLLLLVSSGLSVSLAFVTVKAAFVPGKVFTALAAHRYGDAFGHMVYGTVVYLVSAVLGAAARFCGKCLSLRWYRCLVGRLQELYVSHERLYSTSLPSAQLDNLDQRIVQDASAMAKSLGTVLFGGADRLSLIQILATIVTTSVSAAPYGYIPLLCCWVYTAAGVVAARILLVPIVPLVYQRNLLEGDFRLTHSRVREFSECIALYKGERVEKHFSGASFATLYSAYKRLIQKELPARAVNKVLAMAGMIAAYGCAGAGVGFTGRLGDYDVSSEALFNLVGLLISLTLYMTALPDYLTDTAEMAGFVHRVGELHQWLEAIPPFSRSHRQRRDTPSSSSQTPMEIPTSPHNSSFMTPAAAVPAFCASEGLSGATASTDAKRLSAGVLMDPNSSRLVVSGVSVGYPGRSDELLLSGVSFTAGPGCGGSLLLTGPSGCGKSTLLRVLAGLRPCVAGTVVRPPTMWESASCEAASGRGSGSIMFVPQRPYLFDGTLRSILLYPTSSLCATGAAVSDSQLSQILHDVQLGDLLQYGLDATHPWDQMLSVGEQQRVAFARVLIHRPSVVVLDEATSGMDEQVEAVCMELLRESGLHYISVGHRASLHRLHDRVVDVEATWGACGRPTSAEPLGRGAVAN